MCAGHVIFDIVECSIEEVAAELTVQEGRPVSVQEVRIIEAKALRKLRSECARLGFRYVDLSIGEVPGERQD